LPPFFSLNIFLNIFYVTDVSNKKSSEHLNYIRGFKGGQGGKIIQKKIIITGFIILLIIVSLSGCVDSIGRAAEDTCTCVVLIIVGVIVFIILIAYLLGGKKTVIQTQQASPPPPVIIHEETRPSEWKETKPESDRRCPECGRTIPEDAELCPFCGKKFKLHFEKEDEEPEIETEKEVTFEESEEKILKFCTKCGAQLNEGVSFCTKCGKKL